MQFGKRSSVQGLSGLGQMTRGHQWMDLCFGFLAPVTYLSCYMRSLFFTKVLLKLWPTAKLAGWHSRNPACLSDAASA